MNTKRENLFKRNKDLEELLIEINNIFGKIDSGVLPNIEKPNYPIILINGVARSGTTLLMQWLANRGCFSYPTNLLSRFYGSPFIGAKIQQLLFDIKYNFNNELYNFSNKIEYSSSLGKTKGPLAPNEFWYFWRRFFDFKDIQILTKDQEKNVDAKTFISEIAAIENVFNKPFVMKGMIVNWNLPFISTISDKILFIHIKREPVHNIRSLLSAREKYFGNIKTWYSFKPPEYEKLKILTPIEQVAGQIFLTNNAISNGLRSIDRNRWIEIDYEMLCREPEHIFKKIRKMFLNNGFQFDYKYKGAKNFINGNNLDLLDKKVEFYKEIYNEISKNEF